MHLNVLAGIIYFIMELPLHDAFDATIGGAEACFVDVIGPIIMRTIWTLQAHRQKIETSLSLLNTYEGNKGVPTSLHETRSRIYDR